MIIDRPLTLAANLAEDLIFLRPVMWRNEGSGRVRWQPTLHDGRRLWRTKHPLFRTSQWLWPQDAPRDRFNPALMGWLKAWKMGRWKSDRERRNNWQEISR